MHRHRISQKQDFFLLIDDMIYVVNIVTALPATTATLRYMDSVNFECVLRMQAILAREYSICFISTRFCTRFKLLFAKYSDMIFNKLHVWQHLGDMIRKWGMVWNYWMQAAELAHKLFLKDLLGLCGMCIGCTVAVLIHLCDSGAGLTNYKHFLKQICDRLQRKEFVLDVAVQLGGLKPATIRALEGLPATSDEPDAAPLLGRINRQSQGRFFCRTSSVRQNASLLDVGGERCFCCDVRE